MASYWYSTDGMDHQRLSDRHLQVLDRAFEGRQRIEIHDKQAFGNVAAIADPFLGTMTAGDIHYGLYRNPTLRAMDAADDPNMDSLMMFDSATLMLDATFSTAAAAQQQPQQPQPDDRHCVLVASDRVSPFAGQRRPSAGNRATVSTPQNSTMSRAHHRRSMQQLSEDDECACCVIS